jgi:hypothetical protein
VQGGPKSVLRFVAQFPLAGTKKLGVLRSQNSEDFRNKQITKVFLEIDCFANWNVFPLRWPENRGDCSE